MDAYPFPDDRYVNVGSISTRYWAEGRHGSPVVLIHGLGGFVETWLLAFHELAAHHRVYALDLPGHGRTGKPLEGPRQIADLACFVTEFMAAVGIERAHLVGHSLGGAVSARLALMFPRMADKLALVSSAGLGQELGLALRLAAIPGLGEILTRPSRAVISRSVKTMINAPAEVIARAIDVWFEMSALPGAQSATLRTLRANANLLGQRPGQYGPIVAGLPTITSPALVIWGRQDAVVPAAHAQVAANGLRDVRVEMLDRCGHIPMFEQPDAFNRSVLEFLAD